jgi:hypothetical protein
MFSCGKATKKSKDNAKQPPKSKNGQLDSQTAIEQRAAPLGRRKTFYGKVDDEIVPIKVDFMRMLNDTDKSQVNRFVILTDSLLMVYDEESQSENFYKKIVYVTKAKLTHNKK